MNPLSHGPQQCRLPIRLKLGVLDGAKGWKMLWYIVLPQLRPRNIHRGCCYGYWRVAFLRYDRDHDAGRTVRLDERTRLLHV